MTRSRVVLAVAAVLAAAYTCLSAYTISSQSIEHLLICADSGGLRVPFARTLCRSYLFAFRGTPDDIDMLHQGIGASFVVQGESTEDEREEVLKFLIARGLDVNRADMHRLTPLHGAVVANSPVEVGMLLRNGADPKLQDKRFGLTPLELALKLQSEGGQADRQGVITLLQGELMYDK